MSVCDESGWPSWAREPVELVDHDPGWRRAAADECTSLVELLGPWLAGPVEHVGSTSVPGLRAKPTIDLQAPVATLDTAAEIADVLAARDWHYVPPELDGRPFRRLLVRVSRGRRAAHLHLMRIEEPRWRDQLAFRDALRADATLARDYQAIKERLALSHRGDREAYTEGKAQFVARTLRQTDRR